MEVAVMSLTAREQQALDGIENRLAGSDPRLAALLATFTRLTSDDGMPACEEVRQDVRWTRQVFRRARRLLAAYAGLDRTAALLWALIAIGMMAVAVVLSSRASGTACIRSWTAVSATPSACVVPVPAHSFRPVMPSAS
jgi:hypothetical protein